MNLSFADLLKLLLVGFWTPLLTLSVIYLYTKYFLNRINERKTAIKDFRYNSDEEDNRRLFYEVSARLNELQSLMDTQQSFSERNTERIIDIVSKRLSSEVFSISNKLQNSLSSEVIHLIDVNKENNEQKKQKEAIIREISHALYTPLSRIDALTTSIDMAADRDNIERRFKSIKSAVEICYSYLEAYRNIIDVVDSSDIFADDNLRILIERLAEIYVDSSGKILKFQVKNDSVARLENYSHMFILAIIFPLIENAVEASKDQDKIEMKVEKNDTSYVISIENAIYSDLPNGDIYAPGVSSKNLGDDHKKRYLGGNSGTGLSIVRTLISGLTDAKISHKINYDQRRIKFSIVLPTKG